MYTWEHLVALISRKRIHRGEGGRERETDGRGERGGERGRGRRRIEGLREERDDDGGDMEERGRQRSGD